jgi:hypothetical protein
MNGVMTGEELRATHILWGMNQVPWYGSALIAGGFAILGVLIGMFAAWLSDRRKFKREDERRFHNDLRETGASLITALLEARQQIRSAQRMPERSPECETALAKHLESIRAARGHQDTLKFIASREVNDKALALIEAVAKLDRSSTAADLTAVWTTLDTFTNEVRHELRLPRLRGERKSTLTAPRGLKG